LTTQDVKNLPITFGLMITRMLFDHRKKKLFEMLDEYGADLQFVNKTALAKKLNLPRGTLYLWLNQWKEENKESE
jgi:transposase-like protein